VAVVFLELVPPRTKSLAWQCLDWQHAASNGVPHTWQLKFAHASALVVAGGGDEEGRDEEGRDEEGHVPSAQHAGEHGSQTASLQLHTLVMVPVHVGLVVGAEDVGPPMVVRGAE
jgi:hypothetical protein